MLASRGSGSAELLDSSTLLDTGSSELLDSGSTELLDSSEALDSGFTELLLDPSEALDSGFTELLDPSEALDSGFTELLEPLEALDSGFTELLEFVFFEELELFLESLEAESLETLELDLSLLTSVMSSELSAPELLSLPQARNIAAIKESANHDLCIFAPPKRYFVTNLHF